MLKSDYKVKDLIDSVMVETDSYQSVPQNMILMSYNTVICQLYRTVIREQGKIETETGDALVREKVIKLSGTGAIGNGKIAFEDIIKVESGPVVYSRATVKTAEALQNVYYKDGNGDLAIIAEGHIVGEVTVFYLEKPDIVRAEDSDYKTVTIPLPNEFVPMIYAAVRGEAYKYANQDSLSAKWIADYNAQAETFAAWIADVKPTYGN